MSPSKDAHKAHDLLCQQLEYLRLQHVSSTSTTWPSRRRKAHWSHVDYLARLVEGETHERQERATQRRIQAGAPSHHQDAGTIRFHVAHEDQPLGRPGPFPPQIHRRQGHVHFPWWGRPGQKPPQHCARSRACLAGRRTLFTTAIDIINNLSAAQNAGRLVSEMKKYLRPEVLVMDELGLFAHRQTWRRSALPNHQPAL